MKKKSWMFRKGETVRKAGWDQQGTVMSSWSSSGPRRYRVEWEDGTEQICRPCEIREVPTCAGDRSS